MADLIDRQKAIDALCKSECGWNNAECRHKGDADNTDFCVTCDNVKIIKSLPSIQPEIIYCKDCVKHNKGHGYYYDGTVIGIKDCCPLVEIRGRAQGHEFDYQFCAYAERRTDD